MKIKFIEFRLLYMSVYLIIGLNDKTITQVSVDNIHNAIKPGNVNDIKKIVPEMDDWYPDINKFNTNFPLSFLYLRHVSSLFLTNIRLNSVKNDQRSPICVVDGKIISILNIHNSNFEDEKLISAVDVFNIFKNGKNIAK